MKMYKMFRNLHPLRLKNNQVLPSFNLAYETWGSLNRTKSNAIVAFAGMSDSSHIASSEEDPRKGRWESLIGPEKFIDTNEYFVVCSNILGGCFGSTGPSSMNPLTDRPYSSSFPDISIEDTVKAKFQLLDHLGINKVHSCVGVCIGGMQSLSSAVLFPNRVKSIVSMSATSSMKDQYLKAISDVQKYLIESDPEYKTGGPINAMKMVRYISEITGKTPSFFKENPDFIEKKAESFIKTYDPNTFLVLERAMDSFEVDLERINVPSLIIGVKSDMRVPVQYQRKLHQEIKDSHYYEFDSTNGHSSYIFDSHIYGPHIEKFINQIPKLL